MGQIRSVVTLRMRLVTRAPPLRGEEACQRRQNLLILPRSRLEQAYHCHRAHMIGKEVNLNGRRARRERIESCKH